MIHSQPQQYELPEEFGIFFLSLKKSESLFYLGLMANVIGEREVARTYYMETLQIAQKQNYVVEASEALRHLGFLEQEQKNFGLAEQYLTESLLLLEQVKMKIRLPFAYVAVADVCLVRGDVEKASFSGQKALELARKMDIKKALIFSLYCNGRICQERQEMEQTRRYFEEAYDLGYASGFMFVMQEVSSALKQLASHSEGN